MARLPRLSPPGHLLLVALRGNNRQPIFLDGDDRRFFLETLALVAQATDTAVHAYALAPAQVCLLLTPKQIGGLGKTMQALGRSYVRRFNQRHGRSGTLWEGRYRSTVLQAERYLLQALVALDTWSVREGRCTSAADDLWSSHGHYTGQRVERWLTPHPLMWSLGNTPFAREAAYAEKVQAGLPDNVWDLMMGSNAHKGWALGGADFLAALGFESERRVVKARAGRPKGQRQGANPPNHPADHPEV